MIYYIDELGKIELIESSSSVTIHDIKYKYDDSSDPEKPLNNLETRFLSEITRTSPKKWH